MNLEILKLIQGFLKPDIVTSFTLNNEIKELDSNIMILEKLNRNTDPFKDKLENLIYEKHFGMKKEKYEFFYSHENIKDSFSELQLKKLGLYTYKKNNGYIVSMSWMDKMFNSLLSLIGIIPFIIVLYTLFFHNKEVLDSLSIKNQLFVFIVTLALVIFIFVQFTAPMWHVRKFNKLYSKDKN